MHDSFVATVLASVSHIEMGQSPDSSTVQDDLGVGVPFLQGCTEFGAVNPLPRFSCLSPRKMCRAGDVLISVRAPVGAINIADRDYCIGRGLAAVRLLGIPSTLAGHIVSAAAPALRRVAQGTTFEAISRHDLASLTVLMPNPQDWDRLTNILNVLDTTLHQTEALIDKLKLVKQGLLHDLMTRGIDADGELRPPQSEAPGLYKDSVLGWIPREWSVDRIGSIASSIVPGRDKPLLDGGEFPWITVSDLVTDDVFHSQLGLSVSSSSIRAACGRTMPKNTVVMSCVGSFGTAAVAGREIVANQQLHGFVPRDGLRPHWLMHCIRHRAHAIGLAATQTTIQYLNKAGCESVLVPVPCWGEQDAALERILAIQTRSDAEANAHEKYLRLKSGLMTDLLTGRVRVTPLLEPAA